MVEDGKPWVYEMTGEFKAGLATVPAESIEGTTRRLPLVTYAADYLYVAVYDPPPGVDPEKVARLGPGQARGGTSL